MTARHREQDPGLQQSPLAADDATPADQTNLPTCFGAIVEVLHEEEEQHQGETVCRCSHRDQRQRITAQNPNAPRQEVS